MCAASNFVVHNSSAYPNSFGFRHANDTNQARASAVIRAGRPRLGKSSSAALTPNCNALSKQRSTFGRFVPSSRAIPDTVPPSAYPSSIRARSTRRTGSLPDRTILSNSPRIPSSNTNSPRTR